MQDDIRDHPRQARNHGAARYRDRTSDQTTNYPLPNAPAGFASLSGWSFCSSLPCSSGGSCTIARPRRLPAAAAGEAQPAATVTLTTATAKKGNIGVYLDAIGTVTPVYTTTIISQVTGVISQVHYREGQLVHRGEPLIQIDPRPFQANVLTAQGALERDTNLLAQAQMDLKRYQDAWARNAIPKQTLDDQEKIVLQYQGTVKADQGTLQFDQVQLGFTNITSPITGRVGLRLVDPGNLATASSTTPLAVVTQLQPITVVFTIPEDNVDELQKQMRHRQGAGCGRSGSHQRSQSWHLERSKPPTTRSTPPPEP